MLFFVDLEFMAIVYTTIYVGAVSIFFIFILMTINLRFNDTWEYTDEVYYDRNFSFFILFIFSVLFHDIFYINFRYFLDFKNLLDYYFIFKNQRESHHHLDFLNGLYKTDNFLIDTFANLDFNFFLKPYLYSDIHLLAVNLFTELRMIFLIVTMLLLFSMLASIGFAIRSK
jgi:NADH-ubiquinone oxidoreductase chain 6